MQKKIRLGTVLALSLSATTALAQDDHQSPYQNGGHYDAQSWNPVASAAAMPAAGFQMMLQSMNTVMQPMLAPFTNHPYRNEGHYGLASSDAPLENTTSR